MTQKPMAKPIAAMNPGEFEFLGSRDRWHGYAVGSRDEAYTELERIEKRGPDKRKVDSDDER